MTKQEIFEKVQKEIIDVLFFDLGDDPILEKDSLANDLCLDSLDMVELTMKLEKQFDIKIPDESVEEWQTVGDICTYVETRLELTR